MSLPDFLVMEAYAIAGRDKPKDTYDPCSCLESTLGRKGRGKGWEILQEKFVAVDAFGPQQLVEFRGSPDAESQAMQSRRAYELVQKFLFLLKQS